MSRLAGLEHEALYTPFSLASRYSVATPVSFRVRSSPNIAAFFSLLQIWHDNVPVTRRAVTLML